MKRKIFSKLLMGALLIASVSSFVSCKDYDDDINDLRSQIQGNATTLSQLVDQKIGNANTEIAALKTQLSSIEKAYANADASLQQAINDVKAGGTTTASTIQSLQSEVANLAAAKATTEAAITSLQDGVKAANDAIQTNKDAIAGLVAADKELTLSIATAAAAAQSAAELAQKAMDKANENATELISVNKDIAALQKSVSDNMVSVTASLTELKQALADAQTLLNGKIADLTDKATANGVEITALKAQLANLENSDKEILNKIADVNKELAAKIQANLDAINTIQQTSLRDLKEAAAQAAKDGVNTAIVEALKEYTNTDDVKELIENAIKAANDDNKTLIDAAEANAKKYADDLKVVIEAAYNAAIQKAVGDAVKSLKDVEIAGLQARLDILEQTLFAETSSEEQQTTAAGLVQDVQTLLSLVEVNEETGTSQLEAQILSNAAFVNALKDQVSEVIYDPQTMITEVSLVTGVPATANVETAYVYDNVLDFKYVTENAATFGVNTDNTINFTAGDYTTYADQVLVRVSPASADLTKLAAKNQIKLINSQNRDLDDLIDVVSVSRYTGTLTRSTGTGLWVINFKLKKDFNMDAFKKAIKTVTTGATGGIDNNTTAADTYGRNILYAVAINNTDHAAVEADEANGIEAKEAINTNRYVISEYAVTLVGTAAGANNGQFTVTTASSGTTNVSAIHNRYTSTDNENIATTGIEEMVWVNQAQPKIASQITKRYTGTASTAGNNAWSRFATAAAAAQGWVTDNRQGQPFKTANVNEDIVIRYTDTTNPIMGLYVELDYLRALESDGGELTSWHNYKYEGVGTYQKTGTATFTSKVPATMFGSKEAPSQTATIKITDIDNNMFDVIGFRVFAVNYDGTLVDPDGKAFYVMVSDNDANKNVYADVVTSSRTALASTTRTKYGVAANDATNENVTVSNKADGWDLTWSETNTSSYVNPATPAPVAIGTPLVNPTAGTTADINNLFRIQVFDGTTWTTLNAGTGIATDLSGVTRFNLGINANKAERLIDGSTYTLKLEGYRNYGDALRQQLVQVIYLNITKTLPSRYAFTNFTFRPRQEEGAEGSGKFRLYMQPSYTAATEVAKWANTTLNAGTFAAATSGSVNLNNVFYGLDNNYKFIFANSLRNTSNTADINNVINVTTPGTTTTPPVYQFPVAVDYINSTTDIWHDVTVQYQYRGISTTQDASNQVATYAQDHAVNYGKTLQATYDCWHRTQRYEWGKYTAGTTTVSYKPTFQWTAAGSQYQIDLNSIFGKSSYNNDFFGSVDATSNIANNGQIVAGAVVGGIAAVGAPAPAIYAGSLYDAIQKNWLAAPLSSRMTYRVGSVTQENPYYGVTYAGGVLTFTQLGTQTSEAPTADHNENLEIVTRDAYGHRITLSFEILIKKPGTAVRQK